MTKTKFCRRSFRPTVKTCSKNDWIDCCSSSAASLNWTYSMLCSGKSLYQYLAPGCDIQSGEGLVAGDRKSTRLNSSHLVISYAVFCLKKKKKADVPAFGRPAAIRAKLAGTETVYVSMRGT